MNPFRDGESLIQLLLILAVVGGSVIRFIYNTFIKPRARPRARPQGEQNKPAQDLREFLQEIRRQTSGEGAGKAPGGATAEAPPPDGPPRDEKLQWEGVEPPPEQAQPTEPAGPPTHTGDLRERRQAAKAQARAKKRGRKKQPEEHPGAVNQDSAEPAPAIAESASRGVHQYFKPLSATSTQVPETQAWAGREGSRAVASSRGMADHDARRFPPLPVLGCTLREAIIAQVILSPPRCRQRSYRRQ
jgi:hypothetical protein